MPRKNGQAAALGFRVHSGWATLVAVAGPGDPPAAVDRRRIELVDAPEEKQPYHLAQGLASGAARRLIQRLTASAEAATAASVSRVIEALQRENLSIVACGLLLGSGLSSGSLESTLASHLSVHAAEGELFRSMLARAARGRRLPVTAVRERDLWSEAERRLGVPAKVLKERVAEMGRSIGPPWRLEEKQAALVGWLALAAFREQPPG